VPYNGKSVLMNREERTSKPKKDKNQAPNSRGKKKSKIGGGEKADLPGKKGLGAPLGGGDWA